MHEPKSSTRRPWADPALLAMAGLMVVAIPWFLLAGRGTINVSSWVLQFGLDLVTTTMGVRLTRAATRGTDRRFWRSVILAGISCAIGDGIQAVRVALDPSDHNTGVVQTVLVVVGMSTVVLTMLLHPLGGAGRQRLRLWLDVATVLTGVAVFLWYFTFASALTSGALAMRWASAAACGVMLLVAFAVLKLVLSGSAPFGRGPALLACVGVVGTGVGSTLVSVLTGVDDPRIAAIMQLVPCVLTTGALRLQEVLATPAAAARQGHSRMPYVAVGVTQTLLLVALLGLDPDLRVWGVAAGVLVITALVLGRQLIAAQDNERLLAERDRSMLEVDSQREWFRSLVQHSSDVTLVVGAGGQVRYASPASRRVLGLGDEQLAGRMLGDLAHPDDTDLLRALFEQLAAAPGVDANAQLRMRHADGTLRWLDIVGVDLSDNPSVDGIVLNARDITEARALHDELRHQATHDQLTGLGNRTLLEQRLREAPADEPVGVLLVDLDGFKPINDQRGHHAGDRVLVAVAQRLGALAGVGGTAIRLGGDEFAVLLPGAGTITATQAAAAAVAALVAESIAEPIPLPGGPLSVGASVGTAAGRPGDADRLLRDADVAMYRQKAGHRSLAVAPGL